MKPGPCDEKYKLCFYFCLQNGVGSIDRSKPFNLSVDQREYIKMDIGEREISVAEKAVTLSMS